ncbi:hypothetical protein H4Q26_010687 [Puccinia striiformis f. sp. tritici PST-130]|nr:hypothetical protein H4Q26_010687 [Puccinia striiformis f. sp. tritici PST-130]
MTGCGACPSQAIPSGWHSSASVRYKSRPIIGPYSSSPTNHPSLQTNKPRLHPTNNFLDTVQAAKMQFILATILAVSLLQGTLAAPAPITAQTDTFKQAPSLEKRLYLGGGLGGNLLGTGFVGGFNGYSPLGYAPQYISTSASGANSVYSANSAINSTPWGTTANSNQYSAQNTWANSNTAYTNPGRFSIAPRRVFQLHTDPAAEASHPALNTYQPNF